MGFYGILWVEIGTCYRKASGIRKALGPVRTGTIRFDVTKVLKAILVRRDYMVHLRNQFPNMASYMHDHGTLAWYTRTFGLNSLGEKDGQRVEEQDEEENEQDQQTQASSFMSLKPLVTFVERMMRGTYDIALCKLSGDSIAGKSLNLGSQDDNMKSIISDISAKYALDFPAPKENAHEARITHADGMEVIKSTVQDKADYEIELDKYLKASAENETQQIKEYIMSRIAFVIDDLTDDLPSKIAKQGLAKESKRKMCIYSTELFGHVRHDPFFPSCVYHDFLGLMLDMFDMNHGRHAWHYSMRQASTDHKLRLDGPVAWQQIKARRLNPFGGTGPGVSKTRVERAVNIYEAGWVSLGTWKAMPYP